MKSLIKQEPIKRFKIRIQKSNQHLNYSLLKYKNQFIVFKNLYWIFKMNILKFFKIWYIWILIFAIWKANNFVQEWVYIIFFIQHILDFHLSKRLALQNQISDSRTISFIFILNSITFFSVKIFQKKCLLSVIADH